MKILYNSKKSIIYIFTFIKSIKGIFIISLFYSLLFLTAISVIFEELSSLVSQQMKSLKCNSRTVNELIALFYFMERGVGGVKQSPAYRKSFALPRLHIN